MYRLPFDGVYGISQGFGETDTNPNGHTGIDYLCPCGTPVLASASGTVTYVGWMNGGYGYCVFITHPDGNVTIYEHLLTNIPVVPMQHVAQGDVIGYSGSTGNSTGPHLHFEVRDKDGKPFDPQKLFLMPAETDETKPIDHKPVDGLSKVVCEVAWVRNWESLQRMYTVRRGEPVYVYPDVKYLDGLPFRYIGANRCMAEYDCDGTQILGESG